MIYFDTPDIFFTHLLPSITGGLEKKKHTSNFIAAEDKCNV